MPKLVGGAKLPGRKEKYKSSKVEDMKFKLTCIMAKHTIGVPSSRRKKKEQRLGDEWAVARLLAKGKNNRKNSSPNGQGREPLKRGDWKHTETKRIRTYEEKIQARTTTYFADAALREKLWCRH